MAKAAVGTSEHKCTHETGFYGNADNYIVCCHGGYAGHNYYAYYPTAAQCSGRPTYRLGNSDLATGAVGCHERCGYGWTPDSGQVQVCFGSDCTHGTAGTLAPTGATCGGTDTGVNPETVTPDPAPKLCGGGSCYDPASHSYVAVDEDGNQISVDAGAADGAPSGCGASSKGVVCAGAPPPTPPNPPISDPPGEIHSTDNYHQSNSDGTGAITNVTVNTYGKDGSGVSSGQGSGDSGPASPSTAPSPAGQASGGDNCTSPPVCSGDSVGCAQLRQQWEGRCEGKRVADAVKANGLPETRTPVTKDDIWLSGGEAGGASDGSIGGEANQGRYDMTGMGYSDSCPLTDMTVPLMGRSFVVPFSNACIAGTWIKTIVIAFALFAAARITAGGRG